MVAARTPLAYVASGFLLHASPLHFHVLTPSASVRKGGRYAVWNGHMCRASTSLYNGRQGSTGGANALRLERPIDRIELPSGRGLRVHCLSDLHTDYKDNMAWIKTWPSWKGADAGLGRGHEDVLVVAGDVSSSMERLRETLSALAEIYDQVFFVVGNHDLWLRPPEDDGDDRNSITKLFEVHSACEGAGVRLNPTTYVFNDGHEESGCQHRTRELTLFPLLSWYHASWDSEPDLPPEDQFRNGNFSRRWGDFTKCRWPAEMCSREEFVTTTPNASTPLADFFANQNDACIKAYSTERKTRQGGEGRNSGDEIATVISFSHFVPRQELCPEKRFLSEPMLTKVIGSAALERQVRELGSDVHIYGHTHIPFDLDIEGIRYVQWPLGTTAEQSRQCQRMRERGPFLLYHHDGHTGGLSEQEPTFWGDYYRSQARDVQETFVPEWALKRIRGRRKVRAPAGHDRSEYDRESNT